MYARDSSGKIKVWSISVAHIPTDDDAVVITTEYGQYGGKLQKSFNTIREGKNLGKANTTTPYEQAVKEATATAEAQRRLGYKTLTDLEIHRTEWQDEETKQAIYMYGYGSKESSALDKILDEFLPKDNTDKDDNMIPMKCQKYWKDQKGIAVPRVHFPCFGQPKVNGVRAFISWENGKVVIRSKKGLEYTILEHIEKDFTEDDFTHAGTKLVYDGELYIHGTILSDITSAVRTRSLATQAVRFFTFDLAIPNIGQEKRLEILTLKTPLNSQNIKLVSTVVVKDNDSAQRLTDEWIELGYEGGIFRSFHDMYGFGKRPMYITKLKRLEEMEFKIIDVIPQGKRPDLALFVCMSKGGRFETNPEGSEELRRKYLVDREKLIGKMATVQFYEWTVNNIPFHTKMIAVRDYE